MEIYNTFSGPIKRYLLTPDTKILCPRISFRVKTTEIKNKYDIYSRNCAYGSSMIEGDKFTVSYTHVSSIKYIRIIISITYAEGMIVFILDISNIFKIRLYPTWRK